MRTRLFISRACLVLVLFLSALGCNLSEDTASRSLSEEPSACMLIDATTPVYGPVELFRHTGKPKTDYATFETPLDGEVCVVVTNGLHDPPHGKRISSAWIRIDGKLAIDPDAFSQEVDRVAKPFAVTAGEHELSVKLASKPGSFITVELSFLPEDTRPPDITISPSDGAEIGIDIPGISVGYEDDISGVDIDSLRILLNGADVTGKFSVSADGARYQVGYEDYLPEGENAVFVELSDRMSNTATAASLFTVATPTELLLHDLRQGPAAAARRSAVKLLARRDRLAVEDLRMCLKVVAGQPAAGARDDVLEILGDFSVDPLTRALAAVAAGRIASVDEQSQTTLVMVEPLSEALNSDPSWLVRAAVLRSLGMTGNPAALDAVHAYLDPPYPSTPSDQDAVAYQMTNLVALQAVVRLSDDSSLPHNPPTWFERRDEAVAAIAEYLMQFPR